MQAMHVGRAYLNDWWALSPAKLRAIGALAAMLALAQIGQPFPETAWLHHLPTLVLIVASPVLLRRWPLSDGAVVAIVLFFALHTLGGRWTYSNLPYDEWSKALFGTSIGELFGWERNHYDRLVHLAFGLLGYRFACEVARRHLEQGRGLAALSAIAFVLSVGALYEMFEWLLSLTVAPGVADDYNGQQGDMWDAQKDMGVALAGALAAAAWMRWRRR